MVFLICFNHIVKSDFLWNGCFIIWLWLLRYWTLSRGDKLTGHILRKLKGLCTTPDLLKNWNDWKTVHFHFLLAAYSEWWHTQYLKSNGSCLMISETEGESIDTIEIYRILVFDFNGWEISQWFLRGIENHKLQRTANYTRDDSTLHVQFWDRAQRTQ